MFSFTSTFSSFSVDDLQKAKEFYHTVLGLSVEEQTEMKVLYVHLQQGIKIMVYPKGEAHVPATYTILNFVVDNIDAAVTALTEKGITFEQYDMEYIKTDEKGIARMPHGPTMAWFTDPAGNILSLIQEK